MIKKLKRAAEFLGYAPDYIYEEKNGTILVNKGDRDCLDCKLYNPNEETGRHWLVEMIRKLYDFQWGKYTTLMGMEYRKANSMVHFERWLLQAPSKLCFEKIMEVID